MPHAGEGGSTMVLDPARRRTKPGKGERKGNFGASWNEEGDESRTETGCLGPHLEGLASFPAAQL